MKKLSLLVIAVSICSDLCAQSAKQIAIETKNTILLLSVGNNQRVYQKYFGKKFGDTSEYNQLGNSREVYLTAGLDNQFEPAIRMVQADGNPSLELRFVSTKMETKENVSKTDIVLKDPVYPVQVILHYASYYNEDVIKCWSEISHQEKKPVLLTQYASSVIHVNADEYWLTQFYGDWAREVNMVEERLTNGIKIIES